MAMWLIWKQKIRTCESAPQQLSDCLRGAERAGQFVSAGRRADSPLRRHAFNGLG
jgi:hypothetical protein